MIVNEQLPEQPVMRGRKRKIQAIGQLGSDKNALSGIVDIATIQSLAKGDEVNELVRNYGMVICNECHHVPAANFEKVLSAVTAKYVYSLTATPIRADGHQPIIFMQCDPIRYRVDAKDQAAKRDFDLYILTRFTPARVPDAEELTILELYSKPIADATRNRFIVKDVISALNEGRPPLVLTERRKHPAVMAELMNKIFKRTVMKNMCIYTIIKLAYFAQIRCNIKRSFPSLSGNHGAEVDHCERFQQEGQWSAYSAGADII